MAECILMVSVIYNYIYIFSTQEKEENGKQLYVMHISVSISRDILLNRANPLLYKYYVHAETSKKWEWLPKETHKDAFTNRELSIPVEFIKQNGNN